MVKNGRKVSATGPIVAEYGLTECTLTRVSFVTTSHWKSTHWFQYWTVNVLYILLRFSNFARHMCINWNGKPCQRLGWISPLHLSQQHHIIIMQVRVAQIQWDNPGPQIVSQGCDPQASVKRVNPWRVALHVATKCTWQGCSPSNSCALM